MMCNLSAPSPRNQYGIEYTTAHGCNDRPGHRHLTMIANKSMALDSHTTRVHSSASGDPFELQIQDGWKQIAARAGRILTVPREPCPGSMPLPLWKLEVPEGLNVVREAWPEIRMLLAESCG